MGDICKYFGQTYYIELVSNHVNRRLDPELSNRTDPKISIQFNIEQGPTILKFALKNKLGTLENISVGGSSLNTYR